MRAVLCKQFGPPENLVLENVPAPIAGKGQVLVEVHACSINFPDVLIIQDKYQFKPKLPFSPGAEVGGVIKALGEGVTGYRVGERVIAGTSWGGLAEEVAAPVDSLTRVPDGMDLKSASAFLMTYNTSYHALKDRAAIKPGESLLVLGAAGGVGIAAVELGKAMGARVVAAASSDEKLAIAKQRGADATIKYPSGALDRPAQKELSEIFKKASGGEGFDVVYDPVGGDYAEPAIRAMAWEGRFLVIGFAAGEIPRIPLNLALLKGCQIVGVFLGDFKRRFPVENARNVDALVALFKAGKVKPHISSVYPLERAGAAIRELADRRAKGKVVVVTGRD